MVCESNSMVMIIALLRRGRSVLCTSSSLTESTRTQTTMSQSGNHHRWAGCISSLSHFSLSSPVKISDPRVPIPPYVITIPIIQSSRMHENQNFSTPNGHRFVRDSQHFASFRLPRVPCLYWWSCWFCDEGWMRIAPINITSKLVSQHMPSNKSFCFYLGRYY